MFLFTFALPLCPSRLLSLENLKGRQRAAWPVQERDTYLGIAWQIAHSLAQRLGVHWRAGNGCSGTYLATEGTGSRWNCRRLTVMQAARFELYLPIAPNLGEGHASHA